MVKEESNADSGSKNKKASRKRSVWVEPLFGETKEFHCLRRFHLKGLHKDNIEGMMIAAVQNL
ncbi:transposase [Chloroflexota bacterium]|nr:transposase [Chloroflexota bacterium]